MRELGEREEACGNAKETGECYTEGKVGEGVGNLGRRRKRVKAKDRWRERKIERMRAIQRERRRKIEQVLEQRRMQTRERGK